MSNIPNNLLPDTPQGGTPSSTAPFPGRSSHTRGLAPGEQTAYPYAMRMTVLASGSKGNSTVIASSRTRILVDAGLSCRELIRRMALSGESETALDAIVITHEHIDHVNGLPVLARKLGIPVYFTEPTHRAWVRMLTPKTTMSYAHWLDHLQQQRLARAEATAATVSLAPQPAADSQPDSHPGTCRDAGPADPADPADPDADTLLAIAASTPSHTSNRTTEPDLEDCDPVTAEKAKVDPTFLPHLEYFRPGTAFQVGDILVNPFTTPHDAADPCGFVFESEGVRMAVATDLGYMPPNVKAALKGIDCMLIESNHDLEMLRDGPYPWSVKQRVLSRVGHLSNDSCAQFLQQDYDGGAQYIILGHISESNNVPELARLAAERALNNRMNLLGNRVRVAMQAQPLDPINV